MRMNIIHPNLLREASQKMKTQLLRRSLYRTWWRNRLDGIKRLGTGMVDTGIFRCKKTVKWEMEFSEFSRECQHWNCLSPNLSPLFSDHPWLLSGILIIPWMNMTSLEVYEEGTKLIGDWLFCKARFAYGVLSAFLGPGSLDQNNSKLTTCYEENGYHDWISKV